jgi:hypothetical protein
MDCEVRLHSSIKNKKERLLIEGAEKPLKIGRLLDY